MRDTESGKGETGYTDEIISDSSTNVNEMAILCDHSRQRATENDSADALKLLYCPSHDMILPSNAYLLLFTFFGITTIRAQKLLIDVAMTPSAAVQ